MAQHSIGEREKPPVADAAAKAETDTADSGEKRWISEARRIALEYIRRHKTQDLHPSQSDVCDYVSKSMREAKFYGPQNKPLNEGTIQREAIQGALWKANT